MLAFWEELPSRPRADGRPGPSQPIPAGSSQHTWQPLLQPVSAVHPLLQLQLQPNRQSPHPDRLDETVGVHPRQAAGQPAGAGPLPRAPDSGASSQLPCGVGSQPRAQHTRANVGAGAQGGAGGDVLWAGHAASVVLVEATPVPFVWEPVSPTAVSKKGGGSGVASPGQISGATYAACFQGF
ncbi:MAG: hypothetical protein WDW36_004955 [Sanguina aurantia]